MAAHNLAHRGQIWRAAGGGGEAAQPARADKLVAPDFPRRVLQTVKWLGDVYSVRLEAITVRLFATAPEKYSIAFERLLPLPAEEDFDMTIRDWQAQCPPPHPKTVPLVDEEDLERPLARQVAQQGVLVSVSRVEGRLELRGAVRCS